MQVWSERAVRAGELVAGLGVAQDAQAGVGVKGPGQTLGGAGPPSATTDTPADCIQPE